MSVKIYLGSDHRGFELKNQLRAWLGEQGHQVVDLGAAQFEPNDDYPPVAAAVARAVASDAESRGVLLCGSGIGVVMAANKIAGVRAATGWLPEQVAHGRQADDINVLGLAADYLDLHTAQQLLQTFLSTQFEGQTRAVRRLAQVAELEQP